MDKELFKSIVTPQLESLSAKGPEDAADIICSAYDKALKSKAFSASGQNFLTANLKSLKEAFTNGFKLNKEAAKSQGTSTADSGDAIKTRYQEGKHGIIKFSDTYKDGPIVFVVGGTEIKDEKEQDWYPGIRNANHNEGYMWEQGFNNLNNFHVYNCKTSYDAARGWKECVTILKSKSIKVTKKIIVGFSLGASTMHGVFEIEPASNWDIIHIIGAFMKKPDSATQHIDMINNLKDKRKKVYYFQRDGLDQATEGATVKNKKALAKAIDNPNNIINTTSHNPDGPFKSSTWIRKNITVTKSGNALSNPKPSAPNDAGWNVMTVGLTQYWLSAKFSFIPPSPPAASTANISVLIPGKVEKLPKKLKLAFNEAFSDKTSKSVEAIANTLIEYQSSISGVYTGFTGNGLPITKPWVGVFGDNPNKKETRKNNNIIPLVTKTSFKPLNDGAGFNIKTKQGRFGKYVARIDANGKEVIPAAANDLQSTQKNGRLNLNLLVMVDDGNAILEKNCANAYLKMQEDAKAQGVELKLKFTKASSGYRSLGRPGDLKFRESKEKSVKHRTQYAAREDYDLCVSQKGAGGCGRRRAAPVWPDRGGSNHGWGRAIDIGPKVAQDWIRENGWKYGWYWGEATTEEWHFTWVLSAGIDQTLGPGKFYLYDEKGNINPSDY